MTICNQFTYSACFSSTYAVSSPIIPINTKILSGKEQLHPFQGSFGFLLVTALWPAIRRADHSVHECCDVGKSSWQFIPFVKFDATAQGVGAFTTLTAYLVLHFQILPRSTGESWKTEYITRQSSHTPLQFPPFTPITSIVFIKLWSCYTLIKFFKVFLITTGTSQFVPAPFYQVHHLTHSLPTITKLSSLPKYFILFLVTLAFLWSC